MWCARPKISEVEQKTFPDSGVSQPMLLPVKKQKDSFIVRLPVLAAALCTASIASAQGTVFRGPYVNAVTADAAIVIFESPAPVTGRVRFGVAGNPTRVVELATSQRHQEAQLTGLSAIVPPGGEIHYLLELDASAQTIPGLFRTAPPTGTPFKFVVYGDNRSSPEQHQLVVDALMAESPAAHFAVNTGDLVSDGENESHWDDFFPVAAPFLAKTPLYVAIGNHEIDGNNWDVTQRLFAPPTDVAPASNSEGYYRVIYGNVELIVLNVEVDSLYTVPLLAGDQEDWLEDVLADRAGGVDHRYIFIHQGPYSSKVGRNGNFWMRQWLEDFDTAEIDVVFSGHDHYAERGWAETGIWYVIHGGGGAPLYNTQGPRVTDDHTIVYGESRLGYLTVEVDGPKAHIKLKGLAGELVDEFSYGNAAVPECVDAVDCGVPPANACPGGQWDCHRSACQWVCDSSSSSLIACATDRACEDQIGMSCPGTPVCEHPSLNPLSWYCLCELPPDCAADLDCANRPSPIKGCTGTWACVNEQCEFTTQMCMPLVSDAGVFEDAGTSTSAPDASAGEDAASTPDAAIYPDAELAADAADPADAGLFVRDAGALEIVDDESSCGCHSTSRTDLFASMLLFLGVLIAARRYSKRD
jgi:hypothetical protein